MREALLLDLTDEEAAATFTKVRLLFLYSIACLLPGVPFDRCSMRPLSLVPSLVDDVMLLFVSFGFLPHAALTADDPRGHPLQVHAVQLLHSQPCAAALSKRRAQGMQLRANITRLLFVPNFCAHFIMCFNRSKIMRLLLITEPVVLLRRRCKYPG